MSGASMWGTIGKTAMSDGVRWWPVVAVSLACSVAGCAKSGPTCSDETTVGIVKNIYQEAVTSVLAGAPDSAAARSQIDAATSVERRDVRTVAKSDELAKVSCEAELLIKIPTEMTKALLAPGNILAMAVQGQSLRIEGDRLERSVQYTAQATDDGARVVVHARGVPEVGQFMGFLAAKGLFAPLAPPASVAKVLTDPPAAQEPVKSAITEAPSTAADMSRGSAQTRFGVLYINSDQRLVFNGKQLSNTPKAGDHLEIVKTFQVGERDAVLLEAINGSGCPAVYYMATASSRGIALSASFGTCSDLKEVSSVGDTVSVSMPGFVGNSQPADEQETAARERHRFVYRHGAVAEEVVRPPTTVGATRPSFSCVGKLSSVERVVCETPALAEADRQLASLYAAAMSKASAPLAVKQEQRDWRQTRHSCTDAACVG